MKRMKRLMPALPDPDRPPPLRVLVVTAELWPFSRSGGLADVVVALSSALAERGAEVDVLTPRYRSIDVNAHSLARRLTPVTFTLDGAERQVVLYEGKGKGPVRVFFADHPPLFDREGLYGPPGGAPYEDNPLRFALLCRTALGLGAALARRYDVVHCHDWQAALAAAWLRDAPGPRPRSVLTIHHMAELGAAGDWAPRLGLDRPSALEAGIAAADVVTTVSPHYADEIRTPAGGHGLDGALCARGAAVVGILDGADYSAWDPMNDGYIAARYSSEDIAPKRRCKAEVQRQLRLPVRAEVPLLGTVGRVTNAKGHDLIAAALPALVERGCQVAVLGTGEAALEAALQEGAKPFANNVAVRIGTDDALAHRIVAGSDLWLAPARFEPSGLSQLYALRYGAVPVVHAVGGLADTVEEADGAAETGTGFRFDALDPAALVAAVERGLALYREPPKWRALQKRCMTRDFSWAATAERYFRLFAELAERLDLLPEPEDAEQAGAGPG